MDLKLTLALLRGLNSLTKKEAGVVLSVLAQTTTIGETRTEYNFINKDNKTLYSVNK